MLSIVNPFSGKLQNICWLVLGQLPTGDYSPRDKNKALLLPTRTMIRRTIPHKDNSHPALLPPSKTIGTNTYMYTVGICPGWELSRYTVDLPYICSHPYSVNEIEFIIFFSLSCFYLQEPMRSRAPQLHLEYRFYKMLGQAGKQHNIL